MTWFDTGERKQGFTVNIQQKLKKSSGVIAISICMCVALFFSPGISYTVEIFQDCRRRAGSVISSLSALCSPPEIIYRDTSDSVHRAGSTIYPCLLFGLLFPLVKTYCIEILRDSDSEGRVGQLFTLPLLFALRFPPAIMHGEGDTSLFRSRTSSRVNYLSFVCSLVSPFLRKIMYREKHAGNDIPITCIHQQTSLQSLHTVINRNIIGDNVGQSVLHNTSTQ